MPHRSCGVSGAVRQTVTRMRQDRKSGRAPKFLLSKICLPLFFTLYTFVWTNWTYKKKQWEIISLFFTFHPAANSINLHE